MYMEFSFRLEIILLILILVTIVYGFTFYSCSKCGNMSTTNKEGYTGLSELSDYNIQRRPVNTASWFSPVVSFGNQPIDKGLQVIKNRKHQQIPLPKNELLMFANTPFKPECCPNTYSSSTGCACMTLEQNSYLIGRGSNNVPYSEY